MARPKHLKRTKELLLEGLSLKEIAEQEGIDLNLLSCYAHQHKLVRNSPLLCRQRQYLLTASRYFSVEDLAIVYKHSPNSIRRTLKEAADERKDIHDNNRRSGEDPPQISDPPHNRRSSHPGLPPQDNDRPAQYRLKNPGNR